MYLLVWTECFLVWGSIYSTYQPGPQRTSRSGLMKSSTAQTVPSWLVLGKSGRRSFHPVEIKQEEHKLRQQSKNTATPHPSAYLTMKWTQTWQKKKQPKQHSEVKSYPQNMIPHGGSPKVNVKVGVAVLHSHETVLLNIGALKHRLLRPKILHPWQFPHNLWGLHQIWESITDPV